MNLWAQCQERRRGENWGPVTDGYVESVAGWTGKPGKLFAALSLPYFDKPGWVHRVDGNLIITGWGEYNNGLISRWYKNPSGKARGQSQASQTDPTGSQTPPHGVTNDGKKDPIGRDVTGCDVMGTGEGKAPTRDPLFQEPSLADVQAVASITGVLSQCAEKWFYEQKSAGWLDRNGNPVRDWRSKLQAYAIGWRDHDARKGLSSKKSQSSDLPGIGAAIDRRQRKGALQQLIENHPANAESSSYNEGCTAEDRKELTRLREELETLTREMAA